MYHGHLRIMTNSQIFCQKKSEFLVKGTNDVDSIREYL